MNSIIESIKKHWIETSLIVLSLVYFGVFIFAEPLVDYDEATYAKVIVDTKASGDLSTFTFNERDWFEKPPLYLWLAMGSTALFGEHEFAFRIPSVLAGVVCIWLLYLIAQRLTKSQIVGATSAHILLFTPPFFVFVREARLDSGVIMSMLAAFYFYVRGWREEKYLFWILPLIAIGFLFKSVIAFLILPIMIIYSFFYREWLWIKSKSLWKGLLLALVIFLPWHLLETIRFGQAFWNEYLFHQVFARSTNTLTGTNNYYDYINVLWLYYRPWLAVMGIGSIALFSITFPKVIEDTSTKNSEEQPNWNELFAPLLSGMFIIFLFSIAQTHLSTYIMPAFPFLAMFVALLFYRVGQFFNFSTAVLIMCLVVLFVIGGFKNIDALNTLVTPQHYEERAIGYALKEARSVNTEPFYSLDWPHAEVINYYGGVRPTGLDPVTIGEQGVIGPFYLVTTTLVQTYFFSKEGKPYTGFESMNVLYQGKGLVLIYSDKTVKMPVFAIPE